MAFKLLYTNLAGPQGDFLASTDSFEAGQVGVVSGTSNGDPQVFLAGSGSTGLLGIIDDSRTSQFFATVANEAVVSGQSTLAHANILTGGGGGFNSGTSNASLSSAVNGTIAVTIGGTVSYSYIIPGKAGDDTTLGSGKCTLWLQEGEYATDIFEVSSTKGPADYTVGTKLYVADSAFGQAGRLTVRAIGAATIGFVTKQPTAGNPYMHFFKAGV
jgi:hypothetical protein